MSWTITEDLLAEQFSEYASRAGSSGHGITVTQDTPGAMHYALKDDDGRIYYRGWLVDDDSCPAGVCAWASALEYGFFQDGCTSIFDGQGKRVI